VTIEQRVRKLEFGLESMKAKLANRVQTRAVEVVDRWGHVRAELSVFENGPTAWKGRKGPGLRLYDGSGVPRAVLSVDKGGMRLNLLDAEGRPV